MKTIRKNISISDQMIEMAEQICKLRGFRDFSGLLEQLIREEWERRNGPVKFAEKMSLRSRLENQ